MATSVASPVPPDTENLYRLSWGEIFRIRDSAARRHYSRCAYGIPLEEFQSLGNEVICHVLQDFASETPPPYPLRSCLFHQLHRAMFRLRRDTYDRDMATVRADDVALPSSHPAYALRHDLLQCLRFIHGQSSPRDWKIFCAALEGHSQTHLAKVYRLSPERIGVILWEIKCAVAQYAAEYVPPMPAKKYSTKTSPEVLLEMAELKAAGYTMREIGRRVGLHRVTVIRLLGDAKRMVVSRNNVA